MPHRQRIRNRARQTPLRQRLRTHGTPAEGRLWRAIQRRQIGGFKFRRQYGVGPYVLDFYCPEARLAVELDGAVHDDPQQAEHDAARTRALEAQFIRVIRFSNTLVRDDLDGVCAAILAAAQEASGGSASGEASRSARRTP
jgi:very-short-patch-repair endonuclease